MKNLSSLISSRTTPCKICGGAVEAYGVVDFNKACEESERTGLLPIGINITYQRCLACGFAFTNAFDTWSHEDFKNYIYNDEYKKVDPQYEGGRAVAEADYVAQLFPDKSGINILDYGGGDGHLARNLMQKGFASVDTYEPFVPRFAQWPTKKYNVVTCVEIFEHLVDPESGIQNIARLLDDVGLVVFTTLIQGPYSEHEKARWWYVSPRNGHISIHTQQSLKILWGRHGFHMASHTANFHFAWRQLPPFAQHLFKRR